MTPWPSSLNPDPKLSKSQASYCVHLSPKHSQRNFFIWCQHYFDVESKWRILQMAILKHESSATTSFWRFHLNSLLQQESIILGWLDLWWQKRSICELRMDHYSHYRLLICEKIPPVDSKIGWRKLTSSSATHRVFQTITNSLQGENWSVPRPWEKKTATSCWVEQTEGQMHRVQRNVGVVPRCDEKNYLSVS